MPKPHPFQPGQSNSGMTANVWSCCDAPAADHAPWAPGTTATIRLRREVRTATVRDGKAVPVVYPKGSTVIATRGTYDPLYVIDEWARDEAERFTMVEMPDWSWPTGDRTSVSIPYRMGQEV